MRAQIAFAIAAACFGAGIAFVQIGVSSMIGEKADESWAKVTVTDGASTLSD